MIYFVSRYLQLSSSECLNLDMILEGVISWLVLKKLREHINQLIFNEHVANGSIAQLEENILYVKSKSFQDFILRVCRELDCLSTI